MGITITKVMAAAKKEKRGGSTIMPQAKGWGGAKKGFTPTCGIPGLGKKGGFGRGQRRKV